jgi:hypothetical protein
MIRLSKDFRELLELFNHFCVRYLVVGAYSMSHYGYIRATGDLDLWIDIEKDNPKKVIQALNRFGFNFGEHLSDELSKPNKRLVVGQPPLQVDIMTTIDGVEFKEAYHVKKVFMIDDLQISIISYNDLVKNKEQTGRLKDRADVEELSKRNR